MQSPGSALSLPQATLPLVLERQSSQHTDGRMDPVEHEPGRERMVLPSLEQREHRAEWALAHRRFRTQLIGSPARPRQTAAAASGRRHLLAVSEIFGAIRAPSTSASLTCPAV